MAPKSIKNQSKLNFRAFLFPHRFWHRFLLSTSTPWISKKWIFPNEKHCFFKRALSKIHRFRLRCWCQLASMLASKIEDFSKLWPSKRPSKFHLFLHRFSIDFGSVLTSNMGPSWEPRRLKIRKIGKKIDRVFVVSCFSIRLRFWTSFKTVSASILGGSGVEF